MKIKEAIKKLFYGKKYNSKTYVNNLKELGMRIGERVTIYVPSKTTIDETRPWMIEIGDDVQITEGVTILTHGYDWSVLKGLYGDVLGSCGKVKIGNNVIIGAGAVVSGNIPDNVVVAGNPAKVVCTLDDYYERQIKRLDSYAKIYYKRTKSYLQRELTENDMNWYNQLWKFEGKDQIYAGIKVDGDNISEIISDLKNVKPIYESFDDFKRSIDT